MRFVDFIDDGRVARGTPDLQKANALLRQAADTAASARRLPLDSQTASSVLCLAYDSLRMALEAAAAKEGFRVYSHEAYTHYLEERGEMKVAALFDKYRKLRNGAQYYGRSVSVATAQEAVREIESVVKRLQNN